GGGSASPEKPCAKRLDASTIHVPPDVMRSLGLRTGQAAVPSRPQVLPPFSATLALDTNHLARVHARFAGEVVALGTVKNKETTADTPASSSIGRSLRNGDRVEQNQVLAVLWSKDLGEK